MADAEKATAPVRKGLAKAPKPVLAVGAIAVVAGVIYYKKHHESTSKTAEGNATPAADQGLTQQSFIPVTGEGGGAAGFSGGGGSSGGGNNTGELLGAFKEINTESHTFQAEQSQILREYLQGLNQSNGETLKSITSNLTGGGAPSSGGVTGTVAAPPPVTQAAPPQVASSSPQPTTPSCPSSYPYSGPHGCYKDKKNSKGHTCHYYQNGAVECP